MAPASDTAARTIDDTVARLLSADLCEGNQILAAAADRVDALTRAFRAAGLLMSGPAADGISARS